MKLRTKLAHFMKYKQLTHGHRIEIHALPKAGCNQTIIARIIGVNKSTMSREIKRNTGHRGYRPIQANQEALGRRYGGAKHI